jgi:hypothetical protein
MTFFISASKIGLFINISKLFSIIFKNPLFFWKKVRRHCGRSGDAIQKYTITI